MHINNPLHLRTTLELSQQEAGRHILSIADPKLAYDTWSRLERQNVDRTHMSRTMQHYISILLWLIESGDIDLVKQWIEEGGK